MMNPLIIKLGGVLLDSEEALERLFSALVNYRESHQRPLVNCARRRLRGG
mgnify:CR=1 FL=1